MTSILISRRQKLIVRSRLKADPRTDDVSYAHFQPSRAPARVPASGRCFTVRVYRPRPRSGRSYRRKSKLGSELLRVPPLAEDA